MLILYYLKIRNLNFGFPLTFGLPLALGLCHLKLTNSRLDLIIKFENHCE